MDTTLARVEREAADGRVTDYALGVERMRAGRCPACGGPTEMGERATVLDSVRVAAHERAMQLGLIAGYDQNDPAIARLGKALLPVDDMRCASDPCGWSLSAGWSNPDDPQAGDPGFLAIGSDVYPVTIIRRTRATLFVARDVPVRAGPADGPVRLSFMPCEGAPRHPRSMPGSFAVLDLFTRRKDGTWKRGSARSGPERLTPGYRKSYTDPHL